jgi:hypothetical protein
MSQHHDPVHPDSDHLTAELIADLDEGLLDATSAAHAEHHLAGCASCREIRTALAGVTAGLADLPPVAMPDQVEQRLLAALAANPAAEPVAAATVVPLEAARERRASGWAGRGLGVAASVAAILLVGAIVVPSLMDTGGSDTSDSAAGGSPEALQDTTTQPPVDYTASKSLTKYTPQNLTKQVDQLVLASAVRTSSYDAATTTDPTDSPSEDAASPTPDEQVDTGALSLTMRRAVAGAVATDPAAAQACLEQYLEAGGVQPLAIDIGTFYDEATKEPRPAAVIVLPHGSDPNKVQVWVVDPDCSGPDAALLYFASVSLPD